MRMAPVIDELAEKYDGRVHIGKYNIEEETELSDEYRIMSIPTILFFKTVSRSATSVLPDRRAKPSSKKTSKPSLLSDPHTRIINRHT